MKMNKNLWDKIIPSVRLKSVAPQVCKKDVFVMKPAKKMHDMVWYVWYNIVVWWVLQEHWNGTFLIPIPPFLPSSIPPFLHSSLQKGWWVHHGPVLLIDKVSFLGTEAFYVNFAKKNQSYILEII